VLEQLLEQAYDLYDWIALAGGVWRDPARERLANVNYRRGAPFYFRVQAPVLYKSEF
jgi:hypothetical protein